MQVTPKSLNISSEPVEQIYNEAFDELERGNFITAAQQFDEVERQHPYSIWARRAMVMAAYTYYLQNKYDEAILTARRFIALYPATSAQPTPIISSPCASMSGSRTSSATS